MFNAITLNFDKNTHSFGNIVESLLFYDKVYLIISERTDLPLLWSKIGVDGLDRLKAYGLQIIMSSNIFAYGKLPVDGGEGLHRISLNGESLRHRILVKAALDFYNVQILNKEQEMLVQHYMDISAEYTYTKRIEDAVRDDIYQHFVHKEILQAQLKEINSPLSMYDPKNKYEFTHTINGCEHDINLATNELEEQAYQAGFPDMRFRLETFLIKIAEMYGVMEFAANNESSLSVSPAESLIVSCKQQDIFKRYSQDSTQIANFERLEVSQFSNIAEVVESGEKSFTEILNLLDKAQEFKKWKSCLPNESDFLVEYQNALKSNLPLVQRLPVKWLRYLITTGLGMIPVAGLIAGPAATGLDTFLLDKWTIGGWKPAQFVNGELKKFVEMQQRAK